MLRGFGFHGLPKVPRFGFNVDVKDDRDPALRASPLIQRDHVSFVTAHTLTKTVQPPR